MRAIQPDDESAICAMAAQMRREDLRARFFIPIRDIGRKLSARLTHLDERREFALIAYPTTGGDSVPWGLVSIHADKANLTAEFAIAIRSDHQEIGLGTIMLESLLQIAADRGIREVWGNVLPDNARMLELCTELKFERSFSPTDRGVIRVRRILNRPEKR